jgi:cyclopropane fatty-acyl-phospholipid synthase-like methyltransferase
MAFGISFIPGWDFFEQVIWLAENIQYLVAFSIGLAFVTKNQYFWPVMFSPFIALAFMIAGVWLGSYEDARAKGFDMSLPSVREALENYIETGEGGDTAVIDILEGGKYPPTFGQFELNYLMKDLLTHTLFHFDSHNEMNIPIAYNKGNDWFRSTLGEPMVYTSGIYKTGKETLWEAQQYKMDYVANAIDLQKGDTVLDIGCGWGPMVRHLTDNYGAKVTGLTLSEEQHKFGTQIFNKGNGAKILLQDAMRFKEQRPEEIPEGGFDKIVSLEMAEHVGIKRYDEFLTMVHDLLKDDGVFYFQVAGLRREWDYEDLVWGLFMGEHVFPGADASCPLGWVSTHIERNGFEIQRVSNLGNHYSRTLNHWLDEWKLDKENMIKTYGAKAWRRWEVFLAWSVRVARQGSSTVFMFTLTKAGQNPLSEKMRVDAQDRLVPTFIAKGKKADPLESTGTRYGL